MNSDNQSGDDAGDLVFIRELRTSVNRYLRAVDAWEEGFRRFYRIAAPQRAVTPDLEVAHSEYVHARSELLQRVPRSRRLCARFALRDPFPALLRAELGQHSPQLQQGSAVGRNERAAIAEFLADLEARCIESDPGTPPPQPRPRGILRRILDFFV